MYGVVNGAYSNHHDRLGEINQRISDRNIPSAALRPAFNVRPLSSKYAMMPILETRPVPTVQIPPYQHFTTEAVFNPGNGKAINSSRFNATIARYMFRIQQAIFTR